ncbi:MAG: carbamoyltransferase HypF [Candidatus Hadarchaeota archaeon]
MENKSKARAEIWSTGLVQGVGFRPFCRRLATRLGLMGFVRNMGDAGVQIVVEGSRGTIEKFASLLRSEQPPMARVEDVLVKWLPPRGDFESFNVAESEKAGAGLPSIVPSDMATCDDCLREMMDQKDRRHGYAFITCVNCGPRFTIIESLPYDRPRTSMADFPLCADCSGEYRDPADRRYHAEPTCCSKCGPALELYRQDGEKLEVRDATREAARLLDDGAILAIKGIGGTHVAAKTTSDDVLARLRRLFGRPQQPFALMSKDQDAVKKFAEMGREEEKILTSPQRPIVVLKRRDDSPLSELVAPGLYSVGVMLPYSGIQHLILHHGKELAYVMTSANMPGMPMAVDNREAFGLLGGRVDYLLLHDRKIVNRCDDSVVRFTAGTPVFIRRSRGHVPTPVKLNFDGNARVLALGAELCVTVSVLKGSLCFPSQHIGDVTKIETLEYLREGAGRLMGLLNIDGVDAVACDLHPLYNTTAEAEAMAGKFGAELVKVQHHHAHLASLMAETGVEELVGIAADGVGFGQDGSVWGGEVMVATPGDFERVGGLKKQPMPGGDLATQFPARTVAGILSQAMSREEVKRALEEFCIQGFPNGAREVELVMRQLERGLNVFQTSSCGRILDAVSCLLGICRERTYEGEPAMKLEAAAAAGDPERAGLEMDVKNESGLLVADSSQLLVDVLGAVRKRLPRKDIAAGAQRAVARALAAMAVEAARARGIKTIGASGGVFYNDAITSCVRDAVVKEGLEFKSHRLVPPGDGGISVGQAFVAASRLKG